MEEGKIPFLLGSSGIQDHLPLDPLSLKSSYFFMSTWIDYTAKVISENLSSQARESLDRLQRDGEINND